MSEDTDFSTPTDNVLGDKHYIVSPLEPDIEEALCSCGLVVVSAAEWFRHLGDVGTPWMRHFDGELP